MGSQLSIYWSERAKADVKHIYNNLLEKNSVVIAKKIRDQIIDAAKSVVFADQYQIDEYVAECRRIIVRNYKILYLAEGDRLVIISVFDSHRHPSNMKGLL